jgi:Uma2 family endonuclease
MSTAEQISPASLPIALDMHSVDLSDDQFYQLCRDNRDWRLELTASGELIIMPPTGSLTGSRNADINYQRLGWLIDPKTRRIYVYCPGLPVECLENPESISGDPVLPRFVLNMKGVW